MPPRGQLSLPDFLPPKSMNAEAVTAAAIAALTPIYTAGCVPAGSDEGAGAVKGDSVTSGDSSPEEAGAVS